MMRYSPKEYEEVKNKSLGNWQEGFSLDEKIVVLGDERIPIQTVWVWEIQGIKTIANDWLMYMEWVVILILWR